VERTTDIQNTTLGHGKKQTLLESEVFGGDVDVFLSKKISVVSRVEEMVILRGKSPEDADNWQMKAMPSASFVISGKMVMLGQFPSQRAHCLLSWDLMSVHFQQPTF
jgi:hypothetical protein